MQLLKSCCFVPTGVSKRPANGLVAESHAGIRLAWNTRPAGVGRIAADLCNGLVQSVGAGQEPGLSPLGGCGGMKEKK